MKTRVFSLFFSLCVSFGDISYSFLSFWVSRSIGSDVNTFFCLSRYQRISTTTTTAERERRNGIGSAEANHTHNRASDYAKIMALCCNNIKAPAKDGCLTIETEDDGASQSTTCSTLANLKLGLVIFGGEGVIVCIHQRVANRQRTKETWNNIFLPKLSRNSGKNGRGEKVEQRVDVGNRFSWRRMERVFHSQNRERDRQKEGLLPLNDANLVPDIPYANVSTSGTSATPSPIGNAGLGREWQPLLFFL